MALSWGRRVLHYSPGRSASARKIVGLGRAAWGCVPSTGRAVLLCGPRVCPLRAEGVPAPHPQSWGWGKQRTRRMPCPCVCAMLLTMLVLLLLLFQPRHARYAQEGVVGVPVPDQQLLIRRNHLETDKQTRLSGWGGSTRILGQSLQTPLAVPHP